MTRSIAIWTDNFNSLVPHAYQCPWWRKSPEYAEQVHDFFTCPFGMGYQTVFKDRNTALPDAHQVNLVVLPCPTITKLLQLLTMIPRHLYQWCQQYQVKIIVSFSREHLHAYDLTLVEQCIEKHLISKQYSSDIIKIVINGYAKNLPSKYSDYFAVVNNFDMILRDHVNRKFTDASYKLPYTRTYKFSILAGVPRFWRAKFLLEMHQHQLLNTNTFCTIICPVKEQLLQSLQQFFNSHQLQTLSHIIDSNKPCNNTGHVLHEDIYESMQEWKIPEPVLSSCMHIVLETRPESSSITEKIYKPLLAGLPFIWHAGPGVLPVLQSQGYKPYPYINYDFDSIECVEQRMHAVIQEVIRLNSLDLQKLALEHEHISMHNKENFMNTTQHKTWDWLHA